jgi:cob(I)alamin adenosyltransferase
MKRGYIQVYTGNGKGKTTAAFGLALRALGAGMRVGIIQFMKSKPTCEIRSMRKFGKSLTLRRYGSPRFLFRKPSARDIQLARKGLEDARRMIGSGKFDLIMLDEACVALHYNLFNINDLISILQARPRGLEIIITGRCAPKELIEMADLVTEMREIKHYWKKGIRARKGIEN